MGHEPCLSLRSNRLNGFRLPEEDRYRRDLAIKNAVVDQAIKDSYDFYTLFYDAFYVSKYKKVCLIAPRLLNHESVLKRCRFTSAGQDLSISSISRFKRFTEVWLRCRGVPSELDIQIDGFKAQVRVAHDETAAFRGLNCAVVLSKNNDLSWIGDWARYHVQVHGLQGFCFSITTPINTVRRKLTPLCGR